jgi:hypothetical protein
VVGVGAKVDVVLVDVVDVVEVVLVVDVILVVEVDVVLVVLVVVVVKTVQFAPVQSQLSLLPVGTSSSVPSLVSQSHDVGSPDGVVSTAQINTPHVQPVGPPILVRFDADMFYTYVDIAN